MAAMDGAGRAGARALTEVGARALVGEEPVVVTLVTSLVSHDSQARGDSSDGTFPAALGVAATRNYVLQQAHMSKALGWEND